MADRVDKQWKERGLGAYSTEAILGTLGHYGVSVDVAQLTAEGADTTPLALAGRWKPLWKGTGQFSTFPYAAANELLARLFPGRPTPMKAAAAVLELAVLGASVARGTAPLEQLQPALEPVEALLGKLPPAGERRDEFTTELVGFLEEHGEVFNELPLRLARAGHVEAARRVALVHEAFFPDREGCVQAMVRALGGELEPAVAELASWAGQPERDIFPRYFALDALYQLDAWPQIIAHGLSIFDEAARAERWVLADAIAHLLAHAAPHGDPQFSREVESRLRIAHHHTGGHHH